MRHILLHGHIFKNAGSTLDWSLRRSFGPAFCEHRDDAAMREAPGATLAAAVADASLIALSSHNIPSPPPRMPGIKFHPLLLLRDPIVRVLSVYAFERQQKSDTPGALAAKRLSLREYVAWRLQDDVRPVIRNFQTRFLAGGAVRHGADPLSAETVAAVRRRFADEAAEGPPVGIVERYDASMVVLERALQPLFPQLDLAYVAQNVSQNLGQSPGQNVEKGPASANAMAQERLGPLWEQVLAHNAHDLALYEQACAVLDRHMAALPDFAQELERFQWRLAALRA